MDDYDVPSGGKRYFRYWKNSEGNQVIPGTVISENLALTAEWSDVNFIGQKPAPDAVGDIVFSDGSATPYTEGLTLTAAQKAAAVAVIFYNGTSTDVLGEKMLGVGIHNSWEEYKDEEVKPTIWAFQISYGTPGSSAEGFTNSITDLICTVSFNEGFITGMQDNVFEATFAGTIDGSTSWAALCDAVTDEDSTLKYPAWYWVNGYAEKYELTGDFAEGWYMPSIAELSMLCIAVKEENSVISDAISCVDGTPVTETFYWSSSQADYNGSNPTMAMYVNFTTNKIDGTSKSSYHNSVLAIRAFE